MPKLKDLVTPGSLTYNLLKENGKLDRIAGKDQYKGWEEICEQMGFSRERTPAQEAYLDGYYQP